MNFSRLLALLAVVLFFSTDSQSQGTTPFDVDAYSRFLASHQNLSTDGLLTLHPAGTYSATAGTAPSTPAYWDSIDAYFHFTAYEKSLLANHGFVVTERLQEESFGNAFLRIYNADLPVFVSTDAILHAIHMSYDLILMDVEQGILIPKLDTLLSKLHGQLPQLAIVYAADTSMRRMIYDLDVYLTVPLALLRGSAEPQFFENRPEVQFLLDCIKAQQPAKIYLFAGTHRTVDFSQFTPRGHYTRLPILTRYFQAMIWLGRTEIYLIAPISADPEQPTEQDIQRQIIDAVLLNEAADGAGAYPLLEGIDSIIRFFVGESDNVTLPNIRSLLQTTALRSAHDLLDLQIVHDFQHTLEQQSYTFQRINSQILMSDPFSPEQIRPASAFLLLGQRFVIDSYTTGNVVYDRILFNGQKVLRMLPSTLDILYALGNDASAVLLQPELDRYHYASNLAGLRYLVDSYEEGFWQSSLYNGWLNAIRSLSPPAQRGTMPAFMQTAAWWQEKMNTQLAAWAQLRHDNLLYAKQSYTGGVLCSYPESYVEPLPEFFAAVGHFAASAATTFSRPPLDDAWTRSYFLTLQAIADTLGSVAGKELTGTPLTDAERSFLRGMLYQRQSGCSVTLDGWYPRLYYRPRGENTPGQIDVVVADVHTAPTDEFGNPVGWVLHGGTGPLNTAALVANLPGGGVTAFVGPVLSYYEYVSTNFKRLTDEEWKTAYAIAPSYRPPFVNLYLADVAGNSRGAGPTLLTDVAPYRPSDAIPASVVLAQNFPNPFNGSTIISFSLTGTLQRSHIELTVYNIQGQAVKQLLAADLPAGAYSVRWDGTNEKGIPASSGIYFYHLNAGGFRQVGKMCYLK